MHLWTFHVHLTLSLFIVGSTKWCGSATDDKPYLADQCGCPSHLSILLSMCSCYLYIVMYTVVYNSCRLSSDMDVCMCTTLVHVDTVIFNPFFKKLDCNSCEASHMCDWWLKYSLCFHKTSVLYNFILK